MFYLEQSNIFHRVQNISHWVHNIFHQVHNISHRVHNILHWAHNIFHRVHNIFQNISLDAWIIQPRINASDRLKGAVVDFALNSNECISSQKIPKSKNLINQIFWMHWKGHGKYHGKHDVYICRTCIWLIRFRSDLILTINEINKSVWKWLKRWKT